MIGEKIKMYMKKLLSLSLSTAIVVSVILPIGSNSSSTKVSAAGSSFVNIAKDKVEIGNDAIKRVIDVSDSKLKTKIVSNKRIGKDLVPEGGSEDFAIHLVSEKQTPEEPLKETNARTSDAHKPKIQLDRTNWTATVNDSVGKAKDGATMLDGDNNTYVDFSDGNKAWPYEVVIDLKEEKTIGSFGYQKRPGFQDQAYGINGTIGKYEIKVSSDGKNWADAGTGEFSSKDFNLHKVENLYNVGDMVYGNLTGAKTARYVKIVQVSGALTNDISFTGAEIYLFEDTARQDNKDPGDTSKRMD
ncbi:hypothetical protein COM96_12635 [Bacillus cereus]|uniref:F5/8 type C domain-containing protein n=2 Tax=Bacillus cereus TaxID=1396 RepID=A0A2A7HXU1_BACCE|nr:hypothetical protein COM96_12635 [Bacillus cereus]